MRHLIQNSSYLTKKHANPTQLLAVQQELINFREAVGTGTGQVHKWLDLELDNKSRIDENEITNLVEVTGTVIQQEWVEFKEVKSSSYYKIRISTNTTTLTLNYTLLVKSKNMLIFCQHISPIYTLFRLSPATKEALWGLPSTRMMNNLYRLQETRQNTCNPALNLISRTSS